MYYLSSYSPSTKTHVNIFEDRGVRSEDRVYNSSCVDNSLHLRVQELIGGDVYPLCSVRCGQSTSFSLTDRVRYAALHPGAAPPPTKQRTSHFAFPIPPPLCLPSSSCQLSIRARPIAVSIHPLDRESLRIWGPEGIGEGSENKTGREEARYTVSGTGACTFASRGWRRYLSKRNGLFSVASQARSRC